MTDYLERLYCQMCGDFIGVSHVPVLLTGMIAHRPFYPDGLRYVDCPHCILWHRYEILPKAESAA